MRGHQKYFAVENRDGELAPHFLAVINLAARSKGTGARRGTSACCARALPMRSFSGRRTRRSAGRLSAEARSGHLRAAPGKLRRQSRAHAGAGALACRAVVLRGVDASGRGRLGPRRGTGEVRSGHGNGPRVHRAAGNCGRPLRARARRTRGNRLGGLRSIQAAGPRRSDPAQSDRLRRRAGGQARLPGGLLCGRSDSTGSSDPFALRRAALGIVKIILEQKLPLSISAAISAAARSLQEHVLRRSRLTEAVQKQVLEFLLERARYILRERRGFAYDEINAAFAAGADDLVDAVERVAARQGHPQHQEFRAAGRQLQAHPQHSGEIRRTRATRAGSREAGTCFEKRGAAASHGRAANRRGSHALEEREEISSGTWKISELRPAVDFFFDKVLVMAEDEECAETASRCSGIVKGILDHRGFFRAGAEDSKSVCTEGSA